MKFFIVTCLKEDQEGVYKIFKEARISVFSASEITGYKTNQSPNLLEAWFATGGEKFDSSFLFSFAGDAEVENGLILIKKYNAENQSKFPVRAFIVPVEKSSY